MKIQKKIWETLRKFSLDENDFSVMIQNVARLLRTMTINIDKNYFKSVSWLHYFALIISGICYFHIYVLSMVYLVFFRYSIFEDFIAMSVAISLTACSITSVTKFMFMKFRVSRIRETVESYLRFDAQIEHGSRFAINLRRNLRVVKKRAIFIWICLVANCVIYILIPFFRSGRHFTQDVYTVYGLEPLEESPNFEIIFILNSICITYGAYALVNVAVYIIVIVGYNEAQLYAISEEIKNLWNDGQNFYKKVKHRTHSTDLEKKIVNKYIRNRLKTIIYCHITNIKLFNIMNNQFSDILIIEYTIMSIAIITELLGGLQNTYLQLPYSVVQIYMDCLSGQRLIDACNELENVLYSCEWENFNASNQKTILIMLLISQKPLMMSAGGLANLNYRFLMTIFKSSYSMYTALKSSMQQ